jgi:hypothetical protein
MCVYVVGQTWDAWAPPVIRLSNEKRGDRAGRSNSLRLDLVVQAVGWELAPVLRPAEGNPLERFRIY